MAQSDIIYLDHNATTPLAPEVFGEMEPYLREFFGNPSSMHAIGRHARNALMDSRQRVARRLGATEREIVFTAGGTESNNLALMGVADAAATSDRRQVVISEVEHHAVLHPGRDLKRRGFELTTIPVDREGRLDLAALEKSISERTLLVSVMLANNETGTTYPIRDIAELTRARGALLHTDAVQGAGKLPLAVDELGVDLLSMSAHKFYGPKGVGALYVRKGTPFRSPIRGGNQERRRRPGTQNVAGIVGLAAALDLASDAQAEESNRLTELRDRLEEQVAERLDGVVVNAGDSLRTANTSNLRFDGVDGETLVDRLDREGFAISTGAACAAGSVEPSHVLVSMGLHPSAVQGSIRVSLGRSNHADQLERFTSALVECVEALRAERDRSASSVSGVRRR